MAAEKNADIDFSSPEYYLNRELSELEFQRRVLHEAEDERNPLLERVRALTYFSKNTDEFFMKRIGGLKLEIEAGMTDRGIDGRTPREQWSECLGRFRQMQQSAYDVWESKVRPALAEADIRIEPVSRLPARVRESLRRRMEKSILPMLTPLAFDPAHPFPLISNLSVSLGILVPNEEGEEPTFTRIKVPPNHPAYLPAEEGATLFVSLSDLIRSNIDLVLPGRTVDSAALFRVTRSAEVRLEEPQDDLVEMTLDVLEKRRTAQAIRLEVTPDFPQEILSLLMRRLDLTGSELFRHSEPMALRNLSFLTSLDRPELRYPAWSPRPHPRLESDDTSIFDEIRKGDILLHHPYHSFELTTQRFFDEAAEDPDVLAIKVAIYRTANDSKVIGSLLTAGENGKQVAAIIELKARFDERRNVTWVQRLEEKGIHVAYGMMHRKTHTKIAMVVRREGERLRFYSHIGTGNYHAGTAKTYVDLGLLTADEQVGRDLMHVFNIFTGPLHRAEFDALLVAPFNMKATFLERIGREEKIAAAGRRGRIVVKVNALEDPEVGEALYRAARAGARIDLICRDVCAIRPGADGTGDNLRVHSVVGRFLEHSRIFYFGNDGDPLWYIGSADWMVRNLDNRMEAVVPVTDSGLQSELRLVLAAMLSDNRRRWEMRSDGTYFQVRPAEGEQEFDAQRYLMERAVRCVEGEQLTDRSAEWDADFELLTI